MNLCPEDVSCAPRPKGGCPSLVRGVCNICNYGASILHRECAVVVVFFKLVTSLNGEPEGV